MIQFISYENESEKRSVTSRSFDPLRSTYLVSDLAGKNLVQEKFLSGDLSCLPEDSVLRAQEFWIKILKRYHPAMKTVSASFLTTFVSEWLDRENSTGSARSDARGPLGVPVFPGTAKLVLDYVQAFLSILGSEDLRQNLREWLQANPEALIRWGQWYFAAEKVYDEVCVNRRMISPLWVSGFLSATGEKYSWPAHIVVDVGASLKGSEADLFLKLSDSGSELTVLHPTLNWLRANAIYVKPYEVLGLDFTKGGSEIPRPQYPSCETRRVATELAAVKDVTARVRHYLDNGISIQDIAIVSADLEAFWPCLSAYLEFEGVPSQKSVQTQLSMIPAVSVWLSKLRIMSKNLSTGDLETFVFTGQKRAEIPYEKFKQMFTHIYDEAELSRDGKLRELFDFVDVQKKDLSKLEFFALALKHWDFKNVEPIERPISQVLLECPSDIRMNFRSWVQYLDQALTQAEITVSPGQADGLFCGKLETVFLLPQKHILVLGASQQYLVEEQRVNVSKSDALRLHQDLGIFIDDTLLRVNELSVSWLSQNQNAHSILYFSETDFAGEPHSPSKVWSEIALSKSAAQNEIFHSLWDEYQISAKKNLPEMTEDVEVDLGLRSPKPFVPPVEPIYSASQIEKYLVCPFKTTSEKFFKLTDSAVVDLDIDHMSKGRFIHEVLKELTVEEKGLRWSDQAIWDVIDAVYENLRAKGDVYDFQLWPVRRQEYFDLAKRFLEFEKDWRKKFPQTKTVARELHFKTDLELKNGTKIKVRGQLDRVDSDSQNHLVVLDYKSGGSHTHHGRWLDNNTIQLLFYSYLIGQKLVPDLTGEISGAFYFNLAKLDRKKGFRTEEATHLVQDGDGGKAISSEVKSKLFSGLLEKLEHVTKQISDGRLYPEPKDRKECTNCRWRQMCRAPHLN